MAATMAAATIAGSSTVGTVSTRSDSVFVRRAAAAPLATATDKGLRPDAPEVTPATRVRDRYDVVVVGAGTGGVAAALQAARLGASVLLVEETDWIGGQMSAAAVSSMDEGYPPRDRVRQRGIYGEFYRRALNYYQARGQSVDTPAISSDHFGLEPRVAERLLYNMIRDTREQELPDGKRGACILDVLLRAHPIAVARTGDTVTGVTLTMGSRAKPLEAVVTRKIACKILIDASEYGDVLPLAKVAYRVGSRIVNGDKGATGSALPGESPAVQPITWTADIRQYPKDHYPAGTPSELRVTKAPPGYRPELLTGILNPASDSLSIKFPWGWSRFVRYRGQPDTQWPRNVRNEGSDLVTRTHINFGGNDEDFDVSGIEDPKKREAMEVQARLRTLRVLYYVASAKGSPRADWGVAEEGYRTPYNVARNARLIQMYPELAPYRAVLDQMPVMAYVRESRRIVGLYTMKARDIRRKAPSTPARFPTVVALGDYPVDVHGSEAQRRGLEFDLDLAEDFPPKWTYWGIGPFGVPMESLIPYKVDGLLAAEKNLSQSRVVSGATRLQPSTMLTGQAAGALAGLAVRMNRQPRAIPPIRVQEALLAAGSTLALDEFEDVPPATGLWQDVQLALVYGVLPPEWIGKTSKASKTLKPDATLTPEEADAMTRLLTNATGTPAVADRFRAALPPVAPLPLGRGDTVTAGPTRADAIRAAAQSLRSVLGDRASSLRSDPFPPVDLAEREKAHMQRGTNSKKESNR
jgi:hypothetical protein